MFKIPNPPTPYLGHIVGNFTDGKTVTIEGIVTPPAQRIVINFQTGKNSSHGDDIALQLSAKLLEGTIVRNSFIESVWGNPEKFGHYPLVVGKKFTITVTNQRPKYIIKVNDDTFEFKHRLPNSRVNHLSIEGDVKLYSISYQTNTPGNKFVPLYDDPPPPYSKYDQAQKDDNDMLKKALPYVVGAGAGYLGASLFGGSSDSKKKSNPPRQAQERQESSSSSWGTLGMGVAAVGVIGAVGGILYSLAKGSGENDSDDD